MSSLPAIPSAPKRINPSNPASPSNPMSVDFRDGRREAFVDWLTAPQESSVRTQSSSTASGPGTSAKDCSATPATLASSAAGLQPKAARLPRVGVRRPQLQHEVAAPVNRHFQYLSTLVQTRSRAIRCQSENRSLKRSLWRFRLRRLEAEPIWDSSSTSRGPRPDRRRQVVPTVGCRREAEALSSARDSFSTARNRRGIYLVRGYIPSTDVMSNFLTAFDVDDGRAPCPMRTQTVTAPQALVHHEQ